MVLDIKNHKHEEFLKTRAFQLT